MLEKFITLTDEELVKEIKKGNSDAELELLDRYKPIATVVGRKYYHQFKHSLNCDCEDLINSALLAVFIAAKKFKKGGNFRTYWSTVATNEVMDVIKNNSEKYLSDNQYSFVELDDEDNSNIYSVAENEPENEMYEKIISILSKSSNNVPDIAIEVFKLYLQGYNPDEISKKLKLKPRSAYYYIALCREKLEKILLHS